MTYQHCSDNQTHSQIDKSQGHMEDLFSKASAQYNPIIDPIL
jgi:hypothetical protein